MIYPPIRHRSSARTPRLSWLLHRCPIALITILTLCLLPFLVHALVETKTPKTQPANNQPARLARLSETISVQAAGRGNSTITTGANPIDQAWLGKLNQFNGNFVNAEMVKAFIVSGEYKGRFGP